MSLMKVAEARAAVEDRRALAGPESTVAIPTPQQAKAGLIDQLVGYIPGDALSVFVALTAFSLDARWGWRALALVGVTLLTPIWVVVQYRDAAETEAALRKWPLFQMIVGTFAFLAWSTSVPGSLWQKDLDLAAGAGGAIAVGSAAVIGLAVRYWQQQHRIAKNPDPPSPPD
jgi:hypothetical protein